MTILEKLEAAIVDDEEPDDIPTEVTAELARRLITPIAEAIDNSGLRGNVYTFCGAVVFEWKVGGVHVHLHIKDSTGPPSYIYYDTGETYGTETRLTETVILEWVLWLKNFL